LGDLGRVASHYAEPISLLWRDAGAYLQTTALAATAYRLAFCPLGILGNEVVAALDLNHTLVRAVGSAIIGRPKRDQSYCGR